MLSLFKPFSNIFQPSNPSVLHVHADSKTVSASQTEHLQLRKIEGDDIGAGIEVYEATDPTTLSNTTMGKNRYWMLPGRVFTGSGTDISGNAHHILLHVDGDTDCIEAISPDTLAPDKRTTHSAGSSHTGLIVSSTPRGGIWQGTFKVPGESSAIASSRKTDEAHNDLLAEVISKMTIDDSTLRSVDKICPDEDVRRSAYQLRKVQLYEVSNARLFETRTGNAVFGQLACDASRDAPEQWALTHFSTSRGGRQGERQDEVQKS